MMAALKGQLEMAQLLVASGAEINHSGWTPLAYAAFGGHAQVVEFLIDKGADVDARAPNHATALMMAAKSGHAEVVKLLLEADADTDIKTADGITALKWAKESGHSKIKEMLQKAGARE